MQPIDLESSTLPLSQCTPLPVCSNETEFRYNLEVLTSDPVENLDRRIHPCTKGKWEELI